MRLLRPLLLITLLLAGFAYAQSWPSRPVRFIVPFPPGGSTDVTARVLADKLTRALGEQFIVDNRAGGGGASGTGEAARAAPNGQTILFAANAVTILHLAVKNLQYDTLRDFVAITQVTTQPNAIAVHRSLPAKDIRELVALARARPGELSFAHAGAGSGQHLSGELLKKMAKIDMLGVPYKGGGQAVIDLVGGQVPICILGSTPLLPHHESGRIRILAFTSKERYLPMPEIPTLHESGFPGFDSTQWLGLLAPRGTSADIVRRLYEETAKALALADVRDRLAKAALQPVGSTPEQFAAFIRADVERWSKLAQELGIRPQ